MRSPKPPKVVDIVNFAILSRIGEWLQSEGAADVTEVSDEYILRQMARLDCFSLADVLEKRNILARQLGHSDDMLERKPND